MRLGSNRWLLVALALLALAASGCVQMEENWTVYPDGSGLVKVNLSMKPPSLPGMPAGEAGEEGAENPQMKETLSENDPTNDMEGVYVDPASVKSEFKNGRMTMSAVAYFEDITKVTRKGKAALEWKKTADGGFECVLNKGNDDSLLGAGKKEEGAGGEQDEKMQAMMKEAVKGFRVKRTVQMPGPIAKTGVTKFDDRTFGFELDDKIFESKEAKEKVKNLDVSATCGKPADGIEKEMAAFKVELERAKKAAAEKKASDKGGKGGDPKKPNKGHDDGGEDEGEGK